jgi:hypothetical protein
MTISNLEIRLYATGFFKMQRLSVNIFAVAAILMCALPCFESLIKRSDSKCCAKFADACHLARAALDPYRTYRISWKSIKTHDGHLLFVNSSSGRLSSYNKHQVNTTSAAVSATLRWLEKLMRNRRDLPSVILPINHFDKPLGHRRDLPSPVISLCRSNSYVDILIPTVSFSQVGTVSRSTNVHAWLQKFEKAWYRGHIHSDQDGGSLTLVLEGRTAPDWFDMALLPMASESSFPFKYELSALTELWGKDIPISSIIDDYRYIIDAVGSCLASKLSYTIGSNVALFKVESNESHWFSRYFMPWVHYIPVELSPSHVPIGALLSSVSMKDRLEQHSNLLERMQWARMNPEKVFKIIESSNRFYETYLTEDSILCYIEMLIREYAALCNFDPFGKISELHSNRIRVDN